MTEFTYCSNTCSLKFFDKDNLFIQFVSAYLKLQVFPIVLDCFLIEDGGDHSYRIIDPFQSHLDLWEESDVQESLLAWAEVRRFPFFSQSLLFYEYRFCTKLTQKLRRDPNSMNYNVFKCFKDRMKDNSGCDQIKLWFDIERCLLSQNNNSLHSSEHTDQQLFEDIARKYRHVINSIPLLSVSFEIDPVKRFQWCKIAQDEIMDRVVYYWWPRMSVDLYLNHNRNRDDDNNNVTFLETMEINRYAGDPFKAFLRRTEDNYFVVMYQLWSELNDVLVHSLLYSGYELQRKYMRFYTKYYETLSLSSLSVIPESIIAHYSLLLQRLYAVQEEVIDVLKRKWTLYKQDDYESFYSCFAKQHRLRIDRNLQNISEVAESQPIARQRSSKSRLNNKKLHMTEVVLSVTDLLKTPFEDISNMDILDHFKQYIQDVCGQQSLESSSYQLWLSTLVHGKMPPSAREQSARKLYRKFFSKSAKNRHAPLQGVYNGRNLLRAKEHKAISVTFEEIRSAMVENFSLQLKDFLKSIKAGDNQSNASNSDSVHSSTLDISKLKGFEDLLSLEPGNPYASEIAKKLLALLTDTTISQNRSLKSFERFLGSCGTEQCPMILINDLNFWKEVEKFQNLRVGSASGQLLLRKVEALIDNYLDADTPPWVKISLPINTAREILDTYEEAVKDFDHELEEQMFDLLVKGQKLVFIQLLRHWVEYMRNHVSEPPTPSRVSSESPIPTIKSVRFFPPSRPLSMNNTGRKVSVLSFTRQEGLQWGDDPPPRHKSATLECSSRLA